MLFGLIKPNDWRIIHKESGLYSDNETSRYGLKHKKWYCYLEYSKSRNKYRISATDDIQMQEWFETSSQYQKCLDKQIELQSK